MKVMKFLLGLVFVFGVEQDFLSAAADFGAASREFVVVNDGRYGEGLGGRVLRSAPAVTQPILDDELVSDNSDKDEEASGFVYFMIAKESFVINSSISIKEGAGQFYPIDPRIIYQEAVRLGMEPSAAKFLKIPVKILPKDKLFFKTWFPSPTYSMSEEKACSRLVLRTFFCNYLKKGNVVQSDPAALFDQYFDNRFLQFYELEEPSPAWYKHMASVKATRCPNYFFGLDCYSTEEIVDVTGLEPIAWSDPLE